MIARYTIPPMMVADMVPSGMLLLGFLRSPERPTPAVIPVNAGKQMANTTKNESGSLTVRVSATVSAPP